MDIIEQPKKNIILDATLLTSIMACPRLADFRFNHYFQPIGGKSNSIECGSIVHKFLEVYYQSQINGISRKDAIGFGLTAAELYIQGCPHCSSFVATNEQLKPKCGHQVDEYPGVVNTPKESEGYKIGWHFALDTCEQYAEHYRADHWVPLFVEEVKAKILYEDDEVRIMWKAKLDSGFDTNQGIYPCDHKTMKQRRETVSLNNQFMGQCIIMETRGVFINKIGFQVSLKPAEKFTRTLLSYSAARLMEWQSEILPYYAKLLLMYAEGEHYPPNFTACENKYGTCNFKEVCEADPIMREDEIKRLFVVGKEWNPVSANTSDE